MNPEDWQPIETAPRDGTRVLARCNDCRWPYVAFFGMGGWYSSPGDYSRKPTHWRPLSNPEPERTSDDPCAPPTTIDTPTPSSLSASDATLGTSNPSESVATIGGTPRSDEFAKRIEGISGFMQALRSWPTFARTLETDLLAARAEVERLKAQLTSIIPNSAPASPAWLAKAAQREDALTIAELRKGVERLTKERDVLDDRLLGASNLLVSHEDEIRSLRQQLAEAKQANARAHERVHHLEESGNCIFCETYPATGHAQQVPMCRLCQLESNADVLRSQLSAATARAEEWEKVGRRLQDAAILERIDFRSCAKHYGNHKAEEWDGYKEMTSALSAFDALTQREQV